MPDYVPEFSCKMGACREACCEDWPISFSLDDYFHLSTLDCSPELRDKIDRGVRICLEPRPDRYAEIAPRYDGDCSLRLPDGRCALHAELGEEALTDVCRLYPRGVRKGEEYEISCANSCEGVLELMFGKKEPITFIRREMELAMPPEAERRVDFETLGHGVDLRLWFIRVMQARALSFPERFCALADALYKADRALEAKDEKALVEMMAEPVKKPVFDGNATPGKLLEGMENAEKLLEIVDKRSASVRDYGEEALRYFGHGEAAFGRYLEARERFEKLVPEWEISFEHMLINHMFFSQFPFQDRPENFNEEYMALTVVYTLMRFLSIGWFAQHPGETGFADISAAAFRLIEHTDFEHYAIHLLKEMQMNTPEKISEWILL